VQIDGKEVDAVINACNDVDGGTNTGISYDSFDAKFQPTP